MPKKPPARKPAAALETYRRKRDFSVTSEPTAGRGSGKGRVFVVQEHHARSHHFDFRLELDDVLMSWAVPKGAPEDPQEKRLAVHVEDHPLDYARFEGQIPQGNYGAGTVRIWDSGTWNPAGPEWRESLAKGKLEFTLSGKRLNGAYVLIRMKEPNWLLRKIGAHPEHPEKLPDESPCFISPQLARVVPVVPEGNEWLHEIKLDGYRLIAVRSGPHVKLFTRSGLDWTERFKPLARELEGLPGNDYVLDGEAVVFDPEGRSNFSHLQSALKERGGEGVAFVAFDLLHLDGKSLRSLPLMDRLGKLRELIPQEDEGRVRRSKVWPGDRGGALFKRACKLGLEGIISKKSDGLYQEGARRDWMKSKCRPRQEFVVCGFTAPRNSCPAFGALVLASYEGRKLVPRGKVGTGFSADTRRRLLKQMKPLVTKATPAGFREKHVTWIEPRLVAEIEFAELTGDGSIRQGSFLSLREDKPADEVHLDPIQQATMDAKDIKVAGLRISHPERIVFPDDGITKLEVAAYYERVGELMIPYIRNHPLAIIRAPEGIGGELFFQKSFKAHVPDHVHQGTVDDTDIFYVKDIKGLISLAQFGMLEVHPWGADIAKPDKPDQLIWDLDPDAKVPWQEVLGTARLLKDFLADRNLETIVKTSGGKGIHVILPLRRTHDWEVMKPFAKAVATAVAASNPARLLVDSSLKKRTGRIYIDWLRNGKGATCIAPWGLRARKGAPVSTPINWDDLSTLDQGGFTIKQPFSLPEDWKKIRPQTVTRKHLKEFSI